MYVCMHNYGDLYVNSTQNSITDEATSNQNTVRGTREGFINCYLNQ